MTLEPFDIPTFVKNLPGLPGVYRMLDGEDQLLYIGKAKNLKKRVSSYFQKPHSNPRTRVMVSQIHRIEVTVTRSESEALILESNLIRRLAPRYNVLFKDDKSYPYIMLSGHAFPQIRYYRGGLQPKHQYFGPFPNIWAVRDTIHQLQKIFRLRTCEDTVFHHRSRPCLLFQIKRCSGPCTGEITQESYGRDIQHTVQFLEGKETEIVQDLSCRMEAAAQDLHFELAAVIRDQLWSLRQILSKQFVEAHDDRDVDVIAVASEEGRACLNLVMIRGGRHLGDKSLFPSQAHDVDSAELVEAFLTQHYSEHPIPSVVVCDVIDDILGMADLLSERAERQVQVLTRVRGQRRRWLDMARQNARLALLQRAAQDAKLGGRLLRLQEIMAMQTPLQRMECFDISHTQGEATVASCVVFENAEPLKRDYRRYNIQGVTPGDDYGAMRQVLTRRYAKVAEGEGQRPDLILIDGGKGQLNVALDVLTELGLSDIPVISVAKGEGRKPGLEEILFPDRAEGLRLPPEDAGFHLIQSIRDEAHRFAISGHRARRAKARTVSTLDQIEGIGARRKSRLIAQFGSVKGIEGASLEDLAAVEGIGLALAEKIYRELHAGLGDN